MPRAGVMWGWLCASASEGTHLQGRGRVAEAERRRRHAAPPRHARRASPLASRIGACGGVKVFERLAPLAAREAGLAPLIVLPALVEHAAGQVWRWAVGRRACCGALRMVAPGGREALLLCGPERFQLEREGLDLRQQLLRRCGRV